MEEEYSIEFYETDSGICPYQEWEDSLTVSTRSIVRKRFARIRLGLFGDCEPIQDGVFELRFHIGPGYRVYYGIKGQKVVILLCAGEKKSQKRDINKALKYWGDLP